MFTSLEQMPAEELTLRHARLRALLHSQTPTAGGLMVFSRVNLYYLTGTMAAGLLWLPLEDEPVLLIRRGIERASLESPLGRILPFRSYSDIPNLFADVGSPLTNCVAAEMAGLPWSLSQLLCTKLPQIKFIPGDLPLSIARARKTSWELSKLRLAGSRHHRGMHTLLPDRIGPGMTEREISHRLWEVFFSLGHSGPMRMSGLGEEMFLGHTAVGDSGNYPSAYDGPVGVRGEHPAAPFMGYAGKVWNKGEPLTLDAGFSLEGYVTDKTQVYWPGSSRTIPRQMTRAHQFCIRVQEWLTDHLTPGAVPSQLYAYCLEMAEQEGMAEGFMALGTNKVRFVGHGIGLAVDEYPVLAHKYDQPLEEGMVLALEPKIGLPGVGMVGVENTFEVTASGARPLTGDVFDILCLE